MMLETQCCDNVVTTLSDVATKVQPKPNFATMSCANWDSGTNNVTLAHVVSCEFCEITKNFFTEHVWATAKTNNLFKNKNIYTINNNYVIKVVILTRYICY